MTIKRRYIYLTILFSAFLVLFIIASWFVYNKYFRKVPTLVPGNDELFLQGSNNLSSNMPHILFADFENFQQTDGLNKAKAKSGSYSCEVFGKNSFSAVITRKVAEIGRTNLTKVGFSAWVYVVDDNFEELKADFVFSIVDTKGDNVVWKGVSLNSVFMTPEKWIKVSGSVDIDISTIQDDYSIKTYLWNDSRTNILIDDILVVAGADAIHQGDTVYCDISEGKSWLAQFNTPPFPWLYLKKEEINNNGPYLAVSSKGNKGKIMPHHRIVVGNFYNTSDKKDKILALEDQTINAYSFCKALKSFTHDFIYQPENASLWQNSAIFSAPFTGSGRDDILLVDTSSKYARLCTPNYISKNSCTASPIQVKMNVLWEGPFLAFDHNNKTVAAFIAPRFINTGKASLLVVYTDGHWKLFDFAKSGWQTIAQSSKPIDSWNADKFKVSFLAAPLNSKSPTDVLLSVSSSINGSMHTYALYSYDATVRNLINRSGKVYGTDTLKADYVFFSANHEGKTYLIKSDTSWRFDMKLLVFNDTTYQVLGQYDFKGFKASSNPKFYEILSMNTGNFLNPNRTSFLVTSYNNSKDKSKKEQNYASHKQLPNALFICTPEFLPTD